MDASTVLVILIVIVIVIVKFIVIVIVGKWSGRSLGAFLPDWMDGCFQCTWAQKYSYTDAQELRCWDMSLLETSALFLYTNIKPT